MALLPGDKDRSSTYRPDIDGLRAVAVVAVIVNHMNKEVLPSGYLGVDIFFVISGYVITSSLLRKKSSNLGGFLADFYLRRIRRLVPALVFFVVLTSIFISLVNPEPRLSLGIGWRSLFGISNLQLYKTSTDYFAESTELNPFIHTWSLAVEEQFYLLFPLLIWFTGFGRQAKNGPRQLFFIVAMFSLASLAFFVYLYPKDQAAAYFLMPPRFWEMAAGCLLFLALYRRASFASFVQEIPAFGIALLLIVLFLIPNSAPVPTTMAAVFLSALLIGSLREGTLTYRLLTTKNVLSLGLVSYSLYLWHWPVLALGRWTIGLHWWTVPILLALMLGLAFLSFHLIETPFRSGWSRASQITIFATGLAMLAGAFVVVVSISKFFSARLYLDQSDPWIHRVEKSNSAINSCNQIDLINLECGYRENAQGNSIYLLGDSHIEQFVDPMLSFAREYGYSLILAARPLCLFPTLNSIKVSEQCMLDQAQIEQNLLKRVKSGDIVFVGAAITLYFLPTKKNDATDHYPFLQSGETVASGLAEYKERFLWLANKLSDKNVRIVSFLDGPRFPQVREGYGVCKSPWFAPKRGEHPGCSIDKQPFIAWRTHGFGWLNAWKDDKQRFVMDGLTDRVCNTTHCHAADYIDSNHFDRYYSSYVLASFLSGSGKALTRF